MIRRPPRSTRKESSAASDVYKRQSDMFYPQVLLRRLHGRCARVCACLCRPAYVCLRPYRPCGGKPLTCSGCNGTATEPHFLQHTTAALQVLHSNRTSGACYAYTEEHRSKLPFNSHGAICIDTPVSTSGSGGYNVTKTFIPAGYPIHMSPSYYLSMQRKHE